MNINLYTEAQLQSCHAHNMPTQTKGMCQAATRSNSNRIFILLKATSKHLAQMESKTGPFLTAKESHLNNFWFLRADLSPSGDAQWYLNRPASLHCQDRQPLR